MCKDVIKKIEEEKLIVIVRGVESKKLIPLAEAMYKGGIRLLEVTFDASGKCSDSETAENIKMLCEEFKGRMFIGAGTVLTKKQVELVKKALENDDILTTAEVEHDKRGFVLGFKLAMRIREECLSL